MVPIVMRMIFLSSAEGPGKDSGRRGRWRGNPDIQFDLAQLSPRLCSSRYVSKVRSSFCLVTGENSEESGAALGDQVRRETRKVWFQNLAVEDSLWGCCFVFSPSLQVAQGVQGRKGERWGRTARRPSFNCKNWEQCGSCEDCSG